MRQYIESYSNPNMTLLLTNVVYDALINTMPRDDEETYFTASVSNFMCYFQTAFSRAMKEWSNIDNGDIGVTINE